MDIENTPATASLEYEFQKILVAAVTPIKVECFDSLQPGSDENSPPQAVIEAIVTLNQIDARGSVNTVPAFIHIKNRLASLIADWLGQAKEHLERRFKMYHIDFSGTRSTTPPLPAIQPPSSASNDLPLGINPVRVFGKVSVDRVMLTVFPRHFFDNDCLQIIIRYIKLHLTRDPIMDDKSVHRTLHGEFGTLDISFVDR